MKKLITIMLLVSFQFAFAQEPQKINRLLFKMSPQHLTRNMLLAGIERFSQDRTHSHEFLLSVQQYSGSTAFFYAAGPLNGIGGEYQLRKYLNDLSIQQSKKGSGYFQSIYFAGFVQAHQYWGKDSGVDYHYDFVTNQRISEPYSYKRKTSNAAIGFTIGLVRTFWKVLVIDAYLGAGYQIANTAVEGTTPEFWGGEGSFSPGYSGVLPKIGLKIGVTL